MKNGQWLGNVSEFFLPLDNDKNEMCSDKLEFFFILQHNKRYFIRQSSCRKFISVKWNDSLRFGNDSI